MVDDEDSKVRRNLVAFSAGVLLLAWLRIPTAAIFQKLGADAAWRPDPVRLWVAVGLVLFYLAVRFHFNGGGAKTFNTLSDNFADEVRRGIGRLIEGEGSRRRPHDWWHPPLTDLFAAAAKGFAEATADSRYPSGIERRVRLEKPSGDFGQRSPAKFEDQVKVEVQWLHMVPDRPSNIWTFTGEAGYKVPVARRLAVRMKALWLSWFFSEEALSLMAPAWLAIAASFVVGYRLGGLLFTG